MKRLRFDALRLFKQAGRRLLSSDTPFYCSTYKPLETLPINELNDVPASRQKNIPADIPRELTPEEQKQLKILQLEYDVWQQTGYSVPDVMTDEMWTEIRQCPNSNSRKRLYLYYFKTESRVKQEANRRAERKAELELLQGSEFRQNTFYNFVRPATMNLVLSSRIAHAMRFELPLIIDLDYEELMQHKEIVNLIKQIECAHGINKMALLPFHFLFTGAKEGPLMDQWHFSNQSYKDNLFSRMFTITRKSYMDIVPRQQLIYLSPDAPKVMQRFQHDKVYVVGALVDKSKQEKVSMARAKEQNIAMEKFPLDNYLKWDKGTKSLTIDQTIAILVDLKSGKDWLTALRHVPFRKLKPDSVTMGHFRYSPERPPVSASRNHDRYSYQKVNYR